MVWEYPISSGVDPQVGTLLNPDEGKSPLTMGGLGDTMSHELWDSLEKCTIMWIWCEKSDFLPIMSWKLLIWGYASVNVSKSAYTL